MFGKLMNSLKHQQVKQKDSSYLLSLIYEIGGKSSGEKMRNDHLPTKPNTNLHFLPSDSAGRQEKSFPFDLFHEIGDKP